MRLIVLKWEPNLSEIVACLRLNNATLADSRLATKSPHDLIRIQLCLPETQTGLSNFGKAVIMLI